MEEKKEGLRLEEYTKFIALTLIIICFGLIIQFGFIEKQPYCYKDALGKTIECNLNATYLIEKYNLSKDEKIDYSKLNFSQAKNANNT